MIFLFYASLALQGASILVDELYFHRRRGLPRWEIWGHPLDTFFFALALFLVWFQGSTAISIAAAVFSTLFILKDEWVHAKNCSGGELFLHAFLFVLHPVVLYLAHRTQGLWGPEVPLVALSYMVFQIIYWSRDVKKPVAN